MQALDKVKSALRPGEVYRREDLLDLSNAVDRHLKQLLQEGALVKLAGGLYYCPKSSKFGVLPPSEDKVVETFLKDNRYLMLSPDVYNSLGVGATQLYNQWVVYNHKRHGLFNFGSQSYLFCKKSYFPRKLTKEFLLVDLVNSLDRLAENRKELLSKALTEARSMDQKKLSKAVNEYGAVRTQKLFTKVLKESKGKNVH